MWKILKYNGTKYEDFKINEKGDIIKISTNNAHNSYIHNGYLHTSLHLGGKNNIKNIKLHKALAETFIENPNNYPIVHHIDENKLNNDLKNLQWVSNKQHIKNHLVNIKKRKLTNADVLEIKTLAKTKKISHIAKDYNVSGKTIYNIIQEKLYIDN